MKAQELSQLCHQLQVMFNRLSVVTLPGFNNLCQKNKVTYLWSLQLVWGAINGFLFR